jgi:hypothetical protein
MTCNRVAYFLYMELALWLRGWLDLWPVGPLAAWTCGLLALCPICSLHVWQTCFAQPGDRVSAWLDMCYASIMAVCLACFLKVAWPANCPHTMSPCGSQMAD